MVASFLRGRRGVYVLAAFMLATGTLNTIATKLQDTTVVGFDEKTGEPIHFYHPALQSAFMFAGEALCLVLHGLLSSRARASALRDGRPPPRRKATRAAVAAFALPAALDAAGTTLINVGLFYTAASTYQMLRGTLVVFAGLFTVTVLRRRLHLHHWLGIVLITAGAALVGASSVIYCDAARVGSALSSSSASSNPLLGDVLIVGAQAATALQFIVEEKALSRHRAPALLAVGLEGAWGLSLCALALPALTLASASRGGADVSSPAAALRAVSDAASRALSELSSSPRLQASTAATVLSIACFNFFGVSVTKRLSGASRAAADAARTLLVWGVSLALGWESFHALQVLGFAVLLAGSSLYNELIRGCLPSPSASAPPPSSSGPRASSAGHRRHHHHRHQRRRPSSAGEASALSADLEQGRRRMLLSEPLLLPEERAARAGAAGIGDDDDDDGVRVETLGDVIVAAEAASSPRRCSSSEGEEERAKIPPSALRRARFDPLPERPPPETLSTPPRPTPPSSSAGPSSIAPRPGGAPSRRPSSSASTSAALPLPAGGATSHRHHRHHRYTLARSMRLFPPAAMSPHSLASPLPSGARAGEGDDGGSESDIDAALWGSYYGTTVSDFLDTPDPSGRGGSAAAEALRTGEEEGGRQGREEQREQR